MFITSIQCAVLAARERARTGIPSLKLGYNRVQGFFIEISRSQAERALASLDVELPYAGTSWLVREILNHWKRTLKRIDDPDRPPGVVGDDRERAAERRHRKAP